MEEKTVEADVAALRTDLKQLRADLLALTKSLSEKTKKEATESFEDLKRKSEDLEAKMRKSAHEARTTLEQQVQEKPLGTLLIAFGLGLLLGKASSGR
jgi:ElaB/YqjD/DUF883 family membrane-anchored ribosome-binding protein